MSPSPSMSAEWALVAPRAFVEIPCSAKVPAPSVFSYQAILLSFHDAERTSMSPSPSMSAEETLCAPLALVEISCSTTSEGVLCRATSKLVAPFTSAAAVKLRSPVRASTAGETLNMLASAGVMTKLSPNPTLASMSVAQLEIVSIPPSSTEVTAPPDVKLGPKPRFSYQAILLSDHDAERTSMSPSPSMSAEWTLYTP